VHAPFERANDARSLISIDQIDTSELPSALNRDEIDLDVSSSEGEDNSIASQKESSPSQSPMKAVSQEQDCENDSNCNDEVSNSLDSNANLSRMSEPVQDEFAVPAHPHLASPGPKPLSGSVPDVPTWTTPSSRSKSLTPSGSEPPPSPGLLYASRHQFFREGAPSPRDSNIMYSFSRSNSRESSIPIGEFPRALFRSNTRSLSLSPSVGSMSAFEVPLEPLDSLDALDNTIPSQVENTDERQHKKLKTLNDQSESVQLVTTPSKGNVRKELSAESN
jgi:hypothetical protein